MDYNRQTSYNYQLSETLTTQTESNGTEPLYQTRHMLTRTAVALFFTLACTGLYAQNNSEAHGFDSLDLCPPGVIGVPQDLSEATAGDPDLLPLRMNADEYELVDKEVLYMTGNATIVQGNRGVYADEIIYNRGTYQAEVKGNIRLYTSRGDEISAESMRMEPDTFTGTAQKVQIKIARSPPLHSSREKADAIGDHSLFASSGSGAKDTSGEAVDGEQTTYIRARAEAESVDFEGSDYELLRNVSLTTCLEGNNDVRLEADEIELDHSTGTGTAKNMTVRFKDVPVFYFPKASFPINDERKTGYLFPEFGYENKDGAMLGLPYYINIAPDRDATIVPRILSKRGVQLYGEYRYLSPEFSGDIQGEVLPSDDEYGEDRYAYGLTHNHALTDRWGLSVDYHTVSDSDYMRDFASSIGAVSSGYLLQNATVDYRDDRFAFSTRLAAYEPTNRLTDASVHPYERLPEISFDLREQSFGPMRFGFESDHVSFSHDDLTDGTRLRFKPSLSLPLEREYGYLTPRVSSQIIRYSLNHGSEKGSSEDEKDDSPSVTVPITSIDGGLFFERMIRIRGDSYLQTLEPRMFYVKIPERSKQQDFPNFDTSESHMTSFSHYFRENRFFGGDRVGDIDQMTVGLTSRILSEETGEQHASLSLGQRFYFEDREIGLSNEPETEDQSDLLTELSVRVAADWNLRGFTRYDLEEKDFGYAQVSADYEHSEHRNASVSYSRILGTSEQVNFEFETPVGSSWQLDAGLAYSLEDSKTRSSFLGMTYDGCCWAASMGVQHYLDGNGEFKDRYLFTFALDDLGKIKGGL